MLCLGKSCLSKTCWQGMGNCFLLKMTSRWKIKTEQWKRGLIWTLPHVHLLHIHVQLCVSSYYNCLFVHFFNFWVLLRIEQVDRVSLLCLLSIYAMDFQKLSEHFVSGKHSNQDSVCTWVCPGAQSLYTGKQFI